MKTLKRILKNLGSFLKKLVKAPVVKTITTGLAGIASVVFVLPLELAILSLSVLIFHEFSHYLTALGVGAEPQLPIFIPLGIAIIGLTKVKNLNIKHVKLVALSGPVVGSFLSMLAILLGLALGSSIVTLGGVCSLAFEVYSGTLGSDGSKARQWNRKVKALEMQKYKEGKDGVCSRSISSC